MWSIESVREKPAKEALLVWCGVLATLALSKVTIGLLPYGGSIVGALAVALFLWAPSEAHRRLGRPDEDYGLSTRRWQQDARFALVVMVIVFPLFSAGFRGFLWLFDHHVPREVA